MPVEEIHDEDMNFQIGKGEVLKKDGEVTLIGTGIGVQLALEAAEELEKEGIKTTVINISTIKPIDRELLTEEIKKTGKAITIEEHSTIGGLGSAVAEIISEEGIGKLKRVGIEDVFGQSGKPDDLLKYYGLTKERVVKEVKSIT